jgi:hypothetical protein
VATPDNQVIPVNPDNMPDLDRADSVAGGGERGLVAPLVFKTSGTGAPRPVGSIPAASAKPVS